MSLRLVSIAFNHNPGAATHDALNIRLNNDRFINVPEWTPTSPVTPAAYSIAETRDQQIKIAVTIRSTTPGTIFICAETDAQNSQSLFANVSPQQIDFSAANQSQTLLFNLKDVQLEQGGVNIYNFQWKWMSGPDANGPWTPFRTSAHKIYALLRLPTHSRPWQRGPFEASNKQLPWAEVLEVACDWARGATDVDEAASMITQEVYQLGRTLVNISQEEPGPLLTYNDTSSGGSNYLNWPTEFLCTDFLLRLRRQKARGRYVNCDDCATIVSTFANVLGCELSQSWIGKGGPEFTINPILLIGAEPDDWRATEFLHHAVAWKGAADVDDELFDACLITDGDNDPSANDLEHTELLPVNTRFGRSGERFYQFRLVNDTPNDMELSAPRAKPAFKRVV